MPPILIDIKAAAWQAGRPESTIRWWAHTGRITTHRLGPGRGQVRYDADEIPIAVRDEHNADVILVPCKPPPLPERQPAAA
ncbi:hypothetical protein [Streptomyces aidingensis]|uniref:MerR HTH family regulatory protein n=1 Tax=Streptomyces aidingensis TaxID=910347 RepID=A0A1I1Q4I9_9ACTN|nr:hypothetical protein [Streptomyces aidingensis]SFD14123.1 hypothetical protein SAMN05421773_11096 [Streptomyces aidingensis]